MSFLVLILKKNRSYLWEEMRFSKPSIRFPEVEFSKIKHKYELSNLVFQNDAYLMNSIKIFRVGRLNPRRIDPGVMFFIDSKKLEPLEAERILTKIRGYAKTKIYRFFGMVDYSEFNDDSETLLILIGLIPKKKHLEEFGILKGEKY